MTIIFTSILGGCDSLKPAPVGADRCVCFVDDPAAYPDPMGWDLVAHAYTGDPRREAWRLRCVPHELFPAYDRVVWIDASFEVTDLLRLLRDAGSSKVAALRHHKRSTIDAEAAELVRVGQARQSDIDAQLRAYAEAGYRSDTLSISCVIVRDRSEGARRFNQTWAEQIRNFPGDNTQLSLDFSAWANAFRISPLQGSRHDNPYASHDGADHKKRRRPYQVPA
jgi:hypothetical protein